MYVCQHEYILRNQPISLKLDAMIGQESIIFWWWFGPAVRIADHFSTSIAIAE